MLIVIGSWLVRVLGRYMCSKDDPFESVVRINRENRTNQQNGS